MTQALVELSVCRHKGVLDDLWRSLQVVLQGTYANRHLAISTEPKISRFCKQRCAIECMHVLLSSQWVGQQQKYSVRWNS
jgi:hypothetical protein